MTMKELLPVPLMCATPTPRQKDRILVLTCRLFLSRSNTCANLSKYKGEVVKGEKHGYYIVNYMDYIGRLQ